MTVADYFIDWSCCLSVINACSKSTRPVQLVVTRKPFSYLIGAHCLISYDYLVIFRSWKARFMLADASLLCLIIRFRRLFLSMSPVTWCLDADFRLSLFRFIANPLHHNATLHYFFQNFTINVQRILNNFQVAMQHY